ncbi:unnamed protein product [Gulo gulo]|uniref:UBC core domain-containing protein n=1 Tax=Gulo gulo TaxID=48420 RepID=A0A9X9M604_GULGU|nr:unnamed protein product [Gulo gulo]
MAKTYHPDKLGRICLDILEDKCSPALQIHPVLLAIEAWLNAPSPDDPLANDGAEPRETTGDHRSPRCRARAWTRLSAMNNF